MPSLLELLDGHIFSGITGNFTYDLIKTALERATQKSWETLYYEAFAAAVKELHPWLAERGTPDGEISVDQAALARTLHQDLRLAPQVMPFSALGDETFLTQLAGAMADRSVLIIGGHSLSSEGYAQICRVLVRTAMQHFRLAIIANEQAFRQAILAETNNNTRVLLDVNIYLADRFGLILDRLDRITTGLDTLQQLPAQIEQIVRDTLAAGPPGFVTERAQIELALATERERRLSDRYEQLRGQVDAGYAAAVRDAVVALTEEVDQLVADNAPLNAALQGRILRLAAITFLPTKPGGDAQRARIYLMRARPLSSGDDAVKCQIIESVLLRTAVGIDAALAALASLNGDEVARMRFSLHVEQHALAECQRMIADGLVEEQKVSADLLWTRTLAFYYANIGARDALETCLAALTIPDAPADHFEVAGLVLTRIAFHQLHKFCVDHQVFPDFHYLLDLDPLIDTVMRDRAISYFVQAAERYQQHRCQADAIRVFVSAIRLQMDEPHAAELPALLERLRQLAPNHLLLTARVPPDDEAAMAMALDQLVREMTAETVDPLLILHRARQLAVDATKARIVADLLMRHAGRFTDRGTGQLQFEIAVFELLQQAGADAEAETWLERVSAPEPYQHARPLCHIAFYLPRDVPSAQQWLAAAQEIASEQPEVLATAIAVNAQAKEHSAQLAAAEQLFTILRTPQTALWLLGALRAMARPTEILQLLDAVQDLAILEADIRAYRAAAYVSRGQLMLAREDLEWLVEHGEANARALMALAQLYLRLHRTAEAVRLLQQCITQHTPGADAYHLLTRALLTQGQRDESFQVALRAREQLPGDPLIALQLVQLSFPTGHEHDPEIHRALRDLQPEGQLGDTGLVQVYDPTSAQAALQANAAFAQQITELYQQGQISILMYCALVNVSFSWYHTLVQRSLAIQWVALRRDAPLPEWWTAPRLAGIVLDYTAIYTLWSLFGDEWISFLRPYVESVWIAERLLTILELEHTEMAEHSQLALYQARRAVQERATYSPHHFVHHPPVPIESNAENQGDGVVALAEQLGIPLLIAYQSQSNSLTSLIVDLHSLADILSHAGEIDGVVAQALRAVAAPISTGVLDMPQLPRGTALVTTTATLVAIARAEALDGLMRYMGNLHLLEVDWQALLGAIAEAELRQHTVAAIARLRTTISRGIEDDFIQTVGLPAEQLVLRQHQVIPDIADPDAPPVYNLAQAYTDEVMSIAYRQQLPLWADDRWMITIQVPQEPPVDRVGTDMMLDWLRSRGALGEQQAYTAYGKLISWSYHGLMIDTGYLTWLARQHLASDARSLVEAAIRYRKTLLDLWGTTGEGAALGREAYLIYLKRLVEALVTWCVDQAPPELVATLVRELDISRHHSRLFGKEPTYWSDLLVRLILNTYANDDVERVAPQLHTVCAWLDRVLYQAGVPAVACDEAWLLTTQRAWEITEQVAKHLGRADTILFLQLVLFVMPERSLDYVLATAFGEQLRQRFGRMLQPHAVWTVRDSNGVVTRHMYPYEPWRRDTQRAIAHYLDHPTTAAISTGLVTIQEHNSVPGSLFLRFQQTPSNATAHGHGGDSRYKALFERFADARQSQRRAVWQIAREKLVTLGLPTVTWDDLRPALGTGNARIWRKAGARAIRTLFGHWPVVRDYLCEAITLGEEALQDLLVRIEPADVAAWLGMQPRQRLDQRAILQWAEAANVPRDGAGGTDLELVLRAWVQDTGHSIFPDAPLLRERLLALIDQAGEPDMQVRLIAALISQAEESSSLALKANIVVVVMQWQNRMTMSADAESFSGRLATLTVTIMQPFAPTRPSLAACAHLQQQLCRALYDRWQQRAQAAETIEVRGYLAYVGACWIVEVLAPLLSAEAIERTLRVVQRIGSANNGRPAATRQPAGVFRPAWVGVYNYPAAYLLRTTRDIQAGLTQLLDNEVTRDEALACGSQHRLVQTVLDASSLAHSWLDGQMTADVALMIATALEESMGDSERVWTDEQRYGWLTCKVPETGPSMIAAAIVRLPQSSDDEILAVIGLLGLGTMRPHPAWFEWLHDLLAREQLARIRQSAVCLEELLWQVRDILIAPTGFAPGALQAARRALTIDPDSPGSEMAAGLIGETLARWLAMGWLIDEICEWISLLMAQEQIPIAIGRVALQAFVQQWTEYPQGVRRRVAAAMRMTDGRERYQNLWEVQRILSA